MIHPSQYDALLREAGGEGASALAVVRVVWHRLSPHGKGRSTRPVRRRLIHSILTEHQARKEATS